ncbi:MAG: glycerophosphodiester phosphodiesterase family protein [Dehalococcoidia bacterium]
MAAPFVIGHAAAGGEAPANTLAGVRACLQAAAEAMEIDVQLSADGVPVLMHDTTVDRTTNLKGPVRSLTVEQLAGADAGHGEPVPTLDQVLDAVSGRLTVMCELKATPGSPDQDARLVDAVVATVERHRAHAWTAVHSFNADIVGRARHADQRISAAIISPPVDGPGLEALLLRVLVRNAQAISIQHSCVRRELVVAAKRRQITVWTWTVDDADEWDRLREAGVDGIITNVPGRLRAHLGSV